MSASRLCSSTTSSQDGGNNFADLRVQNSKESFRPLINLEDEQTEEALEISSIIKKSEEAQNKEIERINHAYLYDPKNDGLPPLRCEGKPIEIYSIDAVKSDLLSMGFYKYDVDINNIMKYLSHNTKPQERAQLYYEKLRIEKYTEKDLPKDEQLLRSERELIGQDKVVAQGG